MMYGVISQRITIYMPTFTAQKPQILPLPFAFRKHNVLILVGKHKQKEPLGKSKSWFEDNIKNYVKEIGRDRVHWIHMAQDRAQWRTVVNTAINFRFPYKAENFLASWWTTSYAVTKLLSNATFYCLRVSNMKNPFYQIFLIPTC